MLEIEQVVSFLEDSGWHELDEICKKCELREVKVKGILGFLVKCEFIEINGDGRKLKVGRSLRKFFEETQTVELEAC